MCTKQAEICCNEFVLTPSCSSEDDSSNNTTAECPARLCLSSYKLHRFKTEEVVDCLYWFS